MSCRQTPSSPSGFATTGTSEARGQPCASTSAGSLQLCAESVCAIRPANAVSLNAPAPSPSRTFWSAVPHLAEFCGEFGGPAGGLASFRRRGGSSRVGTAPGALPIGVSAAGGQNRHQTEGGQGKPRGTRSFRTDSPWANLRMSSRRDWHLPAQRQIVYQRWISPLCRKISSVDHAAHQS